MTELMFHPARMGGYGYVLEEAGDAARTVATVAKLMESAENGGAVLEV